MIRPRLWLEGRLSGAQGGSHGGNICTETRKVRASLAKTRERALQARDRRAKALGCERLRHLQGQRPGQVRLYVGLF